MTKWLAALILLLPTLTFAQTTSQRNPCYGTSLTSPNCISVTTGTPLPVVVTPYIPTVNGNLAQAWPDPTKQLFVDDFSTGTLNTINRWQTPTTGSGGVAATNAVGNTVLAGGTTANGFTRLTTQLAFFDKNPGYVFFQSNINLSSPTTSINAVEFIGFGTSPTTPTAAAYCTDCVGFEDGIDGKLRAVTWASAGKTIIADLSVAQGAIPTATSGVAGAFSAGCSCTPQHTDIGSYKYVIYFRGDNILWYMENQTNGQLILVAYTTRGSAGPDVNQLNVLFEVVNNSTPPTVQSTMQINQVTVGDTAGNPTTAISSIAGSASSSLVLKAAAGHLIGAYANCTAACWLMIFNSATAPSNGATTASTASGGLQDCIPIAAGGVGNISYAPYPLEFFSVGITATISSTACGTLTLSTVGFIHGTVQ